MSKKLNLKSDFFWVVAAQLIGLFSGFVGLKILTNMLDPAQFGVYQLGFSVALIVATAIFNPFGHAVIRLHPLYAEKGQSRQFLDQNIKFIMLFLIVIFFIGIICTAILVSLNKLTFLLCFATVLIVAGHGLSLFFQHYQSALRERVTFAISQFFVSFGRPMAAALALLIFSNQEALSAYALWGSGIFLFLFSLVQFKFVTNGLHKKQAKTAEIDTTKEKTNDTNAQNSEPLLVIKPMIIVGILTVFSQYSDRWIVNEMLDLTAVGIYAAVYQIATAPLNFVQGAANRFALPLIFERFSSQRQSRDGLSSSAQMRLMVSVWIVLIVLIVGVSWLAHQFIVQILTTKEIAGYSVLLPLLLSGLALERTAQIITVKGNAHLEFRRYVPVRIAHIIVLIISGIFLTGIYGIFGFACAHIIAGAVILLLTVFTNKNIDSKL